MSKRFEIHNVQPAVNRRKEDATWAVYDDKKGDWAMSHLTKSQAEQVKKALDEAIKPKETAD